jgi:hypothetical protein
VCWPPNRNSGIDSQNAEILLEKLIAYEKEEKKDITVVHVNQGDCEPTTHMCRVCMVLHNEESF